MALELNGTTGVSLVQDGVITDANLPAGSVLQVVQVTTDGAAGYSTTADGGAWTTLMTGSITPSSTNSKILLMTSATVGTNDWGIVFRILQNDSTVAEHLGDTGDSRSPVTFGTNPYGQNDDEISTACYSGVFSPSSTSAVTYKVQGSSRTTTTWSFNRAEDSPSTNTARSLATSSLILMEIAG
jgi:hypothetical protein